MHIVTIGRVLGSPQLGNNCFSESPSGGMHEYMTNRDKEAPMDQAKLITEEPGILLVYSCAVRPENKQPRCSNHFGGLSIDGEGS